jgi:Protein of unknown function (DUF3761)
VSLPPRVLPPPPPPPERPRSLWKRGILFLRTHPTRRVGANWAIWAVALFVAISILGGLTNQPSASGGTGTAAPSVADSPTSGQSTSGIASSPSAHPVPPAVASPSASPSTTALAPPTPARTVAPPPATTQPPRPPATTQPPRPPATTQPPRPPATTQAPVEAPPAPLPSGPPAGATALCNDGTYSFSQHHQGTCSHHGGVAQWL